MRRIATVFSVLAAAVTAFVLTAPSAFAMRVIPPTASDGATSPIPATTSGTSHHTGLYSWEIALIVAGGVVLMAVIAAVAYKLSRRPAPQPAVS